MVAEISKALRFTSDHVQAKLAPLIRRFVLHEQDKSVRAAGLCRTTLMPLHPPSHLTATRIASLRSGRRPGQLRKDVDGVRLNGLRSTMQNHYF